jgi:hypothetical protein
MAKIAFANKVDSITNPLPAINKVDAATLNEIKTSVNLLYDSKGWMVYRDTVNSAISKQTLTALIDNNVTIVDPDPIDEEKPVALGAGNLWVGNKITPMDEGDTYTLRIDFSAEIANITGVFDLKIDIGGGLGVILNRVETFPRGANTAQRFSFTINIFIRNTFIVNGGNLQVNPSHTMLIWDKQITIDRSYAGDIRG